VPPREWRLRLEDILECIAAVSEYTAGMRYDEFAADRRTADAVLRNIAVIGEAATHVPEEVRVRYPGVPWKAMRAMRNLVVHAYFGVSLKIVWETARHDLPDLVDVLRSVLQEEEEARDSEEDRPDDA
jgi:uncharacterized protein with HEPN domain